MQKKVSRKGRKPLKIGKRLLHFAFISAKIQSEQMYRKSNQSDLTPEKFELPVAIELSSENRWVIMSELIPWSELARSLSWSAFTLVSKAHRGPTACA